MAQEEREQERGTIKYLTLLHNLQKLVHQAPRCGGGTCQFIHNFRSYIPSNSKYHLVCKIQIQQHNTMMDYYCGPFSFTNTINIILLQYTLTFIPPFHPNNQQDHDQYETCQYCYSSHSHNAANHDNVDSSRRFYQQQVHKLL